MNECIFEGRLTAEPELKNTTQGTSVCTFNLGVARDYKMKNGDRITDFPTCVAWRNTAELIVKYFHKGDAIRVHGAMESRKFTDKNGNNRVAWELRVEKVGFPINPNKREDPSNAPAPQTSSDVVPLTPPEGYTEVHMENYADEDLPF